MKLAVTGSLKAGENAPIIYRGAYETILPMMREDGFEAVEMHILDSREIDRAKLNMELEKNQMTLTSIGTGAAYGAWHLNIADHDENIRKRAIEILREHMITAAPYGGVIIIGSMQGRFKDAGSPEEFVGYVEESLDILDRLAQEYGVSIGYELMNHYESDFLHRIEDGVRFLKEHNYKNVGLHIDLVHMNIDESDMGAAIRNGGKWINHVHIADNDRYYPGHGHIQFREILQALKDIGYDGALALEIFSKPEARFCARKSRDYMRFMLEEVYGSEKGQEIC